MVFAAAALAVSTLVLAAVGWTVQLVVYPAFALVPAAAWERYHAAHTRAITRVVGPPWVVQGLGTAAVLVLAPADPLAWTAAVLAVAGVLLTLPAARWHGRPDEIAAPGGLRRLLWLNLARTLVWTAGSVVAGVLVARSAVPGSP